MFASSFRFFSAALLAAWLNTAAADLLTPSQREALTTRTVAPVPSTELVRALELGVAPWHREGAAPMEKVRFGPEVGIRSAEAALKAMDALPASAAQNDYDRSWLALERASALKNMGHGSEARAAYERLRQMPRTELQDREALIGLNQLGLATNPGLCTAGKLVTLRGAAQPSFPRYAAERGIEAWVLVMLDMQPDGSIGHVGVIGSSLTAFEKPVIDWLADQQYQNRDGAAPGRPCFARMQVNFGIAEARLRHFSISAISDPDAFTYRSIGAAIRVRVAAREAILAARGSGKPSADDVALPAAFEPSSE